jgi:predicted AAA+ superfamily ATPase
MVNRPGSIEFIRKFYGTLFIKVLSGIRRAGKTSLLKLIQEDMLA